MGHFIGHESCPSCGSRDNLARYDDGGGFCFGCHYQERRTHAPMRYSRSLGAASEDNWRGSKPIPEDVGHEFSQACVEWLSRFHVDVPTAIVNGLVWSPRNEQLIFQLGNCWQARNFGGFWLEKFGKCYTSGDVNECLHIYSNDLAQYKAEGVREEERNQANVSGVGAGKLVIVEDPVSALRIGPLCDAMPLLGSHLAQARLNAVAGLYERLVFWLDSDKYKEARAMADRAKYIGRSAKVIYTDEDPKCYSEAQIKEILQ